MYHKSKTRWSCTPNNLERYFKRNTEYRHFDNDKYLETMVSQNYGEKVFKKKSETTTYLKSPPQLRIVAEYESPSDSEDGHQTTAEIGVTATSKDLNSFFLGTPDRSGDQGKERSKKKVTIATKQTNIENKIFNKEIRSPTPSKQMKTEKKAPNKEIKSATRRFRHGVTVNYDDQNEKNKKGRSIGYAHGCPEGTYYSVPRLSCKTSHVTTPLRTNQSTNAASCTPFPLLGTPGNSAVIPQRVPQLSSGRPSMKVTKLKTLLPPAPQKLISSINSYQSPPIKSAIPCAPQATRASETRHRRSKPWSSSEVQSPKILKEVGRNAKSAIKHSIKI